ncbi:hypothetical protein TURU_111861 [Turdus rufiventris]|nr:hypothetical protein TURU_111861 [Turdus rufiventris]
MVGNGPYGADETSFEPITPYPITTAPDEISCWAYANAVSTCKWVHKKRQVPIHGSERQKDALVPAHSSMAHLQAFLCRALV